MKAAYLFHTSCCCLTDCMVRACTCKVEPEPGPDAPSEGSAIREGAMLLGTYRPGDMEVHGLSRKVDEKDGVLHLHFRIRHNHPDEDEA